MTINRSTAVQTIRTALKGIAAIAIVAGLSLGNTHAPDVVNPINRDRIRRAINSRLADKGYQLVDPANADFIVSAVLGANDEVRIREDYSALGYGYYGGSPRACWCLTSLTDLPKMRFGTAPRANV